MSGIELNALQPDLAPRQRARREGGVRRVLRNPVGVISILVLTVVVLAAIFGPLLAPFGPNQIQLELTNASPFTTKYLLGGDQAGRDILSRLLAGTQGTILASLVVLVVSATIGVATGLIAGYFGGVFDAVAEWISDVLMAFPGFVLLVALYVIIGPNIMLAMAVFGVLIAPAYFRLVRNLVLNVKHELYVDAAKVFGLSDRRILSRHVLRAVQGPVIVQSTFILAAGVGIQAGLQFLGLGSPLEASWGGMLQDSLNNIYVNPINVIWPALAISLLTLALILLGNVVRDETQPTAGGVVLKPAALRDLKATANPIREQSPPIKDESSPLLQVRNLALGYPDSTESVSEVLRGVDLTVRQGEIHGLVGESGSGKSQTAFAVIGILPREAVVVRGAIEFHGEDLLADPRALRAARGRRIAYVPQEPMTNLDPTFTIGQQLSYGLRAVKKVSRSEAKDELVALLDRVGIKDPAAAYDMYPHQMSGGMAQRVLIAGALAGEPELLIADEPTTALDVTVQAEVLDLIRDLQRERNLGVLLVTHNLGVVADICDTVSVMKEGRIVETQTVEGLFAHPAHDYTKMLLGATLEHAPMRKALSRSGSRS